MTDVIMYNPSNTFSEVEDVESLLYVETSIDENNEDINNFFNTDTTRNLIESKFETALSNSNISYCKPYQVIGSFYSLPSFVIPKYQIAIFLNLSSVNTQDKVWKTFTFDND
jgi:hypothetical protein